MKKKFPKTRKISVEQQAFAIKRYFPDSQYKLHKGRLTWEGSVSPSYLSESYKVQIRYKLVSPPKVFILNPALDVLPKKDLPHVWDDGSLCLYYWKGNEWKPDMYIADTILPWTSEWLYHYEIWLVTGEWLGGGVH